MAERRRFSRPRQHTGFETRAEANHHMAPRHFLEGARLPNKVTDSHKIQGTCGTHVENIRTHIQVSF